MFLQDDNNNISSAALFAATLRQTNNVTHDDTFSAIRMFEVIRFLRGVS